MTDAVRQPTPLSVRVALPDERPRVELATSALRWQLADTGVAIGLLLAIFAIGNYSRVPQDFGEFLAMRISVKSVLLLTGFALVWPFVLTFCGLYQRAVLREGRGEVPRLLLASVAALGLALVFALTSRSGAFRPIYAVLFALAITPVTAGARRTVRTLRRRQGHAIVRRALLVGSGPLAEGMYRDLVKDELRRWEIIGFVDDDPQSALAGRGLPHLGGFGDLERVLMQSVVDEVMICLPIKSGYEQIQQAISASEKVGVPARYAFGVFRTSLGPARLEQHADSAVLALTVAPHDYRLSIKRAADVAGAAGLLVLLSPLLIGIALAVKFSDGGPVLFGQERYGYMKRRFRMYKFRSMVPDAEHRQSSLEDRNEAVGPVFKIRDDPRVTRLGGFLRRTSLDELPQFWNVLAGDMSLVGPRPLTTRDVGRFAEARLMRRFSMRPGLTCLWQIRGRSRLTFDQWIAYDLEYIDGWSLALDASILLRTPGAVLRGDGAT